MKAEGLNMNYIIPWRDEEEEGGSGKGGKDCGRPGIYERMVIQRQAAHAVFEPLCRAVVLLVGKERSFPVFLELYK